MLGKGSTQWLDDTKITAEAKCSINFAEFKKRFVLSLHYCGSNSFLFVSATKMYQFKAKGSEIKPYILSFRNILKDFTIDNMIKTGLNRF